MSKYPAGAAVTVYYNPDNPAVAVLEPGARWENYGLVAVGILFIGIGLGGILWNVVSAVRAG